MREIRLYGHLGEKYGRVFNLDVKTHFEAAQALCEILPGFKRDFIGEDGQQEYHVYLGNRSIGLKECALESDQAIQFVPAIQGAGFGDIFQVVLGAALIVGSFFVAPFSPPLATAMANVGVALVFNGVAGLLSSTPNADQPEGRDGKNTTFDGAENLSAAGNPVPVLLGRGFCGSVVVSAELRSEQLID